MAELTEVVFRPSKFLKQLSRSFRCARKFPDNYKSSVWPSWKNENGGLGILLLQSDIGIVGPSVCLLFHFDSHHSRARHIAVPANLQRFKAKWKVWQRPQPHSAAYQVPEEALDESQRPVTTSLNVYAE